MRTYLLFCVCVLTVRFWCRIEFWRCVELWRWVGTEVYRWSCESLSVQSIPLSYSEWRSTGINLRPTDITPIAWEPFVVLVRVFSYCIASLISHALSDSNCSIVLLRLYIIWHSPREFSRRKKTSSVILVVLISHCMLYILSIA